jgi:hypothetical protein
MTSQGDMPTPNVDPQPDRAPGGADAVESVEGDVTVGAAGAPVIPDAPLSAQQDEAEVPDELHTGERPEPAEQETDNTDTVSS